MTEEQSNGRAMIPTPSERFPKLAEMTDADLEAQIAKAVRGLSSPTATATVKFPPLSGIAGQRETNLAARAKVLAEAAGWAAEIVSTRGSGPLLRIWAPR